MELFELKHLGEFYYFTSHQEDIVNGETYKAIAINRKEITRSLKKSDIVITAPIDVEPFNTMINSVSADLSEMSIYRYPEDTLLFKGRVLKITMNYAKKLVTLNIGQKTQLGNSMIPNRTYSVTCGYNFCDRYCGLNREDLAINIPKNGWSISSDGYKITSNSIASANSRYKEMIVGGYIINDKATSVAFINDFDNDKTIELLTPMYGKYSKPSESGLKIYLTCDKSFSVCKYTYHNAQRYGGFPFIPTNNINTGKF